MTGASDDGVCYRRPPRSTRFAKGRSGNPRGRPKGRTGVPYEAVLDQPVTVIEGGVERRVTAAEAFLLHMAKKGLEGDGAAARALLEPLARARAAIGDANAPIAEIVLQIVSPGNPNMALEPLRMATRLDAFRPTARMLLEPWLVEAALAQLGARRLSAAEQEVVVKATRTPRKVRWPNWWSVRPKER